MIARTLVVPHFPEITVSSGYRRRTRARAPVIGAACADFATGAMHVRVKLTHDTKYERGKMVSLSSSLASLLEGYSEKTCR